MIAVDKDAQKTDGFQRNDNLLLSPKARADSIPGLKFWLTTFVARTVRPVAELMKS